MCHCWPHYARRTSCLPFGWFSVSSVSACSSYDVQLEYVVPWPYQAILLHWYLPLGVEQWTLLFCTALWWLVDAWIWYAIWMRYWPNSVIIIDFMQLLYSSEETVAITVKPIELPSGHGFVYFLIPIWIIFILLCFMVSSNTIMILWIFILFYLMGLLYYCW